MYVVRCFFSFIGLCEPHLKQGIWKFSAKCSQLLCKCKILLRYPLYFGLKNNIWGNMIIAKKFKEYSKQ